MKNLTSLEALELLKKERGTLSSDDWITHSICVGETAGVIAKNLGLDEDKAKAMGFIHDIGRSQNVFNSHVLDGYNYIKSLGFYDEYANICLTHSYLNNDVECNAGLPSKIEFVINFVKNHKYTLYDKIINLCDLMCTKKRMTMEERLIDLLQRHGVFQTTPYHLTEALKLKKEIDNLLGFNVYSLFPDIIDNLTK